MKKQITRRGAACVLAGLLCLAPLAGCNESDPASTAGTAVDVPDGEITYAESYADVYQAVQAVQTAWADSRLYLYDEEEETAAEAAIDTVMAGVDDGADVDEAADYSKTNVQVAGVDEGDIVKTDGSHIYILRDNRLIIVEAEGEQTHVVSTTEVNSEDSGQWLYELYLCDDYVLAVSDSTDWEGDWPYQNGTAVHVYDCTDPAAPRLVGESGQSGYYLASRMIDGTLYLLTSFYSYSPVEEAYDSYIPAIYQDGEAETLAADCIAIYPGASVTTQTLVSAYAADSGEVLGSLSLLGAGETVYMNRDNLYLAGTVSSYEESDPYTRDGDTYIDYRSASYTALTRLSLSGGEITLAASGSVPGYLDSQFSMDEYDGHLRLVSTLWESSGTNRLEGEYYSFSSWEDDQSNALYVLDGDLEIVGSVEHLAEDEQVYSARFDGDIGYFVTFRQTDPLFAVDLSDPENPQVLSALKIPGFSEYLHLFSGDRLFGLGMDADEETGWTQGMKLSMFDTSDPADVTEKHTLALDSDYSTALYNHRAILVSAERDLIAFPADGGYAVYGYSDEEGFYLRARMEGDIDWYWMNDARGLYIGELFYVVLDEVIQVYDLTDFVQVAELVY